MNTQKLKYQTGLLVLMIQGICCQAQISDDTIIHWIFSDALINYESYENLKLLCDSSEGRLPGSPASQTAISIMKNKLIKTGTDTIYLQKYKFPAWYTKSESKVFVSSNGRKSELSSVTLGRSPATPENGIEGKVIEVRSLHEINQLGTTIISGNIVFYNRPFDNTLYSTYKGYEGAMDQRIFGPVKAAEYGATGTIVRSLATSVDDFPHTGVVLYNDSIKNIPAVAISTKAADYLHKLIETDQNPRISMYTDTNISDSVETANLIAEIKGSTYPDKIILIGAHLDAWFNTEGAHDDGAGCVQAVDVLRIFNHLRIKPKHTIRVVLYMDEEMNGSGAKKYARLAQIEGHEYMAAIESDRGGFTPSGFTIEACDSVIQICNDYIGLMEEYGIFKAIKGFPGSDIQKLNKLNFPLIGLLTDSQRYFEYHHSANDTFDKVNRRELQLGTAAMAALVYLIDKYGFSGLQHHP